MPELNGKIAIVTGAGRGIGAGIARAYANEGATIVVSDRDGSAAASVADELGGAASAFRCDVTAEDEVAALIAHATEIHGGLDVLVANAGIAPPVAGITDTALEDWRRVQDVNVDGVFLCIKHAAPGWSRAAAARSS